MHISMMSFAADNSSTERSYTQSGRKYFHDQCVSISQTRQKFHRWSASRNKPARGALTRRRASMSCFGIYGITRDTLSWAESGSTCKAQGYKKAGSTSKGVNS